MPSRINIGPEDGPYVAINESSGNLQLEDNSGNVVAEWDETNAQWDFVENDISGVGAFDSESVNTEQASIGQVVGTVFRSTDQTISSGSVTTIEFDNVRDEDTQVVQWDDVNYEWVAQEAGTYLVVATTGFQSFVSGNRYLFGFNGDIFLNTKIEDNDYQGDDQFTRVWSGITQLAENERVSVTTFQNTGQEQVTTTNTRCAFKIVRLG